MKAKVISLELYKKFGDVKKATLSDDMIQIRLKKHKPIDKKDVKLYLVKTDDVKKAG